MNYTYIFKKKVKINTEIDIYHSYLFEEFYYEFRRLYECRPYGLILSLDWF